MASPKTKPARDGGLHPSIVPSSLWPGLLCPRPLAEESRDGVDHVIDDATNGDEGRECDEESESYNQSVRRKRQQ